MVPVVHKVETYLTKRLGYRYLLRLPPDYTQSAHHKWPLLIFLHGMGERGDDPNVLSKHGPLSYLIAGGELPFIVAVPQCPADHIWEAGHLAAVLDHLCTNYCVDRQRVYLTGFSMGGAGTWAFLHEFGELIAAAAPLAGFFTLCDPRHLKDVPIWAIHGALDTIVPPTDTIRMVRWLREAGADVRLTIDPEANHTAITAVYHTPALYDWFLSQQKVSSKTWEIRADEK